jgi:alkanesulfonate monooxygenase SsuD/methylene tetrahydromethanopterin reductase-like flavin-dependent oxidoreductase (luciferase family)
MRLGVVLDGRRPAGEIAELAARAEEAGLAQFWLSGGARTKDHFQRLAVAATRTRTIRLGPIAVSPFETHPARLAIEILTLQEIAGGRAEVVVGGGGDFAATLAVPLRNRVAAVEDALAVVRALARGGELNFRGAIHEVRGLFSPWRDLPPPALLVGANRPRMLAMAARAADGVMFTDMPAAHLAALIARLRDDLRTAGRVDNTLRISNWLVWNVQESRAHAHALATRLLGFRLYYVRDVAPALGLSDEEAAELERRQPEMVRAVFEGRAPWQPPPPLAERLVRELTLSGGPEDLDACVERLRALARLGLTEVALALHGDPAHAIRLLGTEVAPRLRRAAG